MYTTKINTCIVDIKLTFFESVILLLRYVSLVIDAGNSISSGWGVAKIIDFELLFLNQ